LHQRTFEKMFLQQNQSCIKACYFCLNVWVVEEKKKKKKKKVK